MSRGVLYLCWPGTSDYSPILERSVKSVRHWHPELEHRVVYLPADSTLLDKRRMYDLSPFDETLFLDADTTVLGKLDYGFVMARRHGMALCISANPWQRRYENVPHEHPDEVEYSSGVVFFDKNHPRVGEVFRRWNEVSRTVDSSARYQSDDGVRMQPHNDQALLTLAIHESGFCPFVLSPNWNLFPKWQRTFWGPVKIHHGYDNIPASLLKWNEEQSRTGAVIRIASLP